MATIREVEHGLVELLRQAAEDYRAARVDEQARRAIRDRLVVAAIDAGVPQRAVVAAAGICRGRVIQIVSSSG
jgi:hypothetical protein